MKLVLTLLVRDEADVVDAHLAFHLSAGVDLVLATDHRSADGTTEILERYAAAGVLRLFRREGELMEQGRWVTRMARLAATEHGADWVINADADEFWWPRAGDLKESLASVPGECGIVRAPLRSFPPVPRADGPFAERMTVRALPHAPVNDPAGAYRPSFKVAHRADPGVEVGRGNHELPGSSLAVLGGWHPLEILHFPVRSLEQYERKYRAIWSALGAEHRADHVRVERAREAGRLRDSYEALVVDGPALERGVGAGVLVEDTRLRNALCQLAPFGPEQVSELSFPRPSAAEEAMFAVDVAVTAEAELVRMHRRGDALALRLGGHR